MNNRILLSPPDAAPAEEQAAVRALRSGRAAPLGAWRSGRPAGSSGDVAILSFNGNKLMTTSNGGMPLTDDDFAKGARFLATQARQPVVHYEHTEDGYNYRLSNILAAIGRAQLARLDETIARESKRRLLYRDIFADVRGVEAFGTPDGSQIDGPSRDNSWLSVALVDPKGAGRTSAELMNYLAQESIESRPLWKPTHMQPIFAGLPRYIIGTSKRLFQHGFSLPSGSPHGNATMERVAEVIQRFLAAATRARNFTL